MVASHWTRHSHAVVSSALVHCIPLSTSEIRRGAAIELTLNFTCQARPERHLLPTTKQPPRHQPETNTNTKTKTNNNNNKTSTNTTEMSTSAEVVERITSLPSATALRLLPDLRTLVLAEKDAWNAHCDRHQDTSFARALDTLCRRALGTPEWHCKALDHLTTTLPARLAMLTIKGHHPEGGNGNCDEVAELAGFLQATRQILLDGACPVRWEMLKSILQLEATCAISEGRHADAVEGLRAEMERGYWGRGTGDVVMFAEWMVSVGISLEGLF